MNENDYLNSEIKLMGKLLIPIIFLIFVYISYGIFIQGFLSTEIYTYFGISPKTFNILNGATFLGMLIGVILYSKKKKSINIFFNGISIILILLYSMIFFINNYVYFLVLRLLTGIWFGYLFLYLNNFYLEYKLRVNIKDITFGWGRALGAILASIFTFYFSQILSWKYAFLILTTGIFVIVGLKSISYIYKFEDFNENSFCLKNKNILIYSILYFLVGTNYYTLSMNIKNILMIYLNDYMLSNIGIIIFSFSILIGCIFSIFLYNKYNIFTLMKVLTLFLMIISFFSLFLDNGYYILDFLSLNIFVQTIIWNISLHYSLIDLNKYNPFKSLKLMIFMLSLGGVSYSIFTYIFYENLYIFVNSYIFLNSILLLILSKNYQRDNHFMKR
jgi:MFS family permease